MSTARKNYEASKEQKESHQINKIIKVSDLDKKIRYSAEASLDERVETVRSFLQTDLIYWDVKRTIKEAIFSPDFTVETLKQDIKTMLQETKLATGLRNAVYLYDEKAKSCAPSDSRRAGHNPSPPIPFLEEPIEVVKAARASWDNRLRYELRSVAAKQKRKLVQLREFHNKDDNDYLIRFVYTSEDLLETIMNIPSGNASSTSATLCPWGLLKLEIATPSLHNLRKKYKELHPDNRQIGVDDTVMGCEWFTNEQYQEGHALLATPYIAALREFAKTGVPAGVRPLLWCKCVGVELSQRELHYFENLLAQVQQYDMITDDLTRDRKSVV